VNALLLLLALLCHMLPLLFRISGASASLTAVPTLQLSRASSIVMLVAYITYIIFQLVTHRQLFEAQEVINWSNYSFPSEWCDQIKSLKRHKIKMYLKFLQDRLAEILITWRNSSGFRRRWWWCEFRRNTCDRLPEWNSLAGWNDCCRSLVVRICCGDNRGSY